MNVDFVDGFRLLSHSNLYLEPSTNGKFSTSSQKSMSFKTEQIATQARAYYDDLRKSRDSIGEKSFKTKLAEFQKDLDGYRARVMHSLQNRWWYCIAQLLGIEVQLPKSLTDLVDDVVTEASYIEINATRSTGFSAVVFSNYKRTHT